MSKKFLLIYRNPLSTDQKAPSPAEMQTMLAAWGKWKAAFPQIVDMGDGLLPTGKRLKSNAVTDGPMVESKEIISGYSIAEAASYDEVVKVAQACPILVSPGGSVEVRELAQY